MNWAKTTCFLLVVACVGCVGTEVGNPQDSEVSEVTFDFAAVAPMADALTLANGIEVDRALLSVEELGLRPSSSCDGDDRIDLENPFAIDVIDGSTQPEIGPVVRPAISYCRLDIELMSSDVPTGLPGELDNRAIYIEGSLEDQTPFEVSIREDDDIRIEGDFALTPGSDTLIVGFDVSMWLGLEDFDGLEADPDGVIRIDTDNEELEEVADQIREKIVASVTLFRDTNNNQMLDPGVDVVVGTAAEEEEEEE